jgi:DNA-directed RNA polymerase subunit RPC12/RpoP
MLLVYLPNKAQKAALDAANDVTRHIKDQREILCPSCGSRHIYLSRKSDGGSKWMEIEAICGDCPTRFAVPDEVLKGFWRGNNSGPVMPLTVSGELAGVA